jgi:type IV pilus assembly protein PilP
MIQLLSLLIAALFFLPCASIAEEIGVSSKPQVKKETAGDEGGYVYEPRGRRDPFLPLIEIRRRTKETGKKKTPAVLGTLESYDIPDFQLIAVIEKGKGNFVGLLLSADKKTFVVKKGTVIGLYEGKITGIYPDRAVVTEYIKDYKGVLKPRQVVLELYEGGAE